MWSGEPTGQGLPFVLRGVCERELCSVDDSHVKSKIFYPSKGKGVRDSQGGPSWALLTPIYNLNAFSHRTKSGKEEIHLEVHLS